MQALGFLGRSLPPGPERDLVGACSHFVDTWVVIPGLTGCVLTGLFYSCLTAIGFFRFAWIGYKWLIACSAGFWGTLFWGPWGAEITQALQPYGLDGFMRMMRWFVLPENGWTALLQTAIVLSVCLVSVYRPLSFRFWQKDLEEKDIRRRVRAVRAMDRSGAMRSPLDNAQVAFRTPPKRPLSVPGDQNGPGDGGGVPRSAPAPERVARPGDAVS